jgi:hypothetical protein
MVFLSLVKVTRWLNISKILTFSDLLHRIDEIGGLSMLLMRVHQYCAPVLQAVGGCFRQPALACKVLQYVCVTYDPWVKYDPHRLGMVFNISVCGVWLHAARIPHHHL